MSTSTTSMRRPVWLLALVIPMALLGAIATGFGLYLIVQDLLVGSGPDHQLVMLLGLFVLVPGVVELVLAYSLWKLQLWAWWVTLIIHGLVAAVLAVTWALTFPAWSISESLTFAGLLLFVACFFIPQVRQAFRRGH